MNRTVTVDSVDKSKVIIDGQETNLERLTTAVSEVEKQITELNVEYIEKVNERTAWLEELKDNVASAISQGAITDEQKTA